MRVNPETRLINRIRAAITSRWPDAWMVKVSGGPYQTQGLPDLFVCVEGRFIGLEVKAQRRGETREHALGRVTALQSAQLARIAAAGGRGEVVLDLQAAIVAVEAALAER